MEILDLLKQRLADAEDDVLRLQAAIAELERDDSHPPATRRPPARGGRDTLRAAAVVSPSLRSRRAAWAIPVA